VTDVARALYQNHYKTISKYVDILASTGIEWGVIGPREVDRLWDRHVLNGAALADLLPQGSTVVDVGSGAGIPGIPLAVLRPDLQMTLLEPLLRRFNFLTQAVENLGITNIDVVRGRAEEHLGRYEAVTARALAPLGQLVEWCDPLRKGSGDILALKGRSAADELAAAAPVLARLRLSGEVLTVRAHQDAESATVVRVAARAG
jgi:16S rRNA (guanine527-N7)-methyltransferase